MSNYADYIAKVQNLMERSQKDDVVLRTIVNGFHALGQKYFDDTRSGYIGEPEDEDDEDLMPLELYTKDEFYKQQVLERLGVMSEEELSHLPKDFVESVQEEVEEEKEQDEVAFSDSYRHAGLIDIETLEVIDPRTLGIPLTDYIFAWSVIQELPAKLVGTNYVALHADTEDGMRIFFPMPTL